jgi:YD repeat-containing protein
VKFPFHLHAHMGDHPLIPGGHNYLDTRANDVKINVADAAQSVPDDVRNAPLPTQTRVVTTQLAPAMLEKITVKNQVSPMTPGPSRIPIPPSWPGLFMASGTPQARTITTTWDTTFNLPATITDGNRVLSFAYDANGNLLTRTVTAPGTASTWSYTYNSAGQALTATDPVGHVTTYAYDALGDLAKITNALGQVTLDRSRFRSRSKTCARWRSASPARSRR